MAEGIRAWPVLLTPDKIAPGRIAEEHELCPALVLAFLREAIPFRLHSHFAPLVHQASEALRADLFLVLMAIRTRPADPPVWFPLALKESAIFAVLSCHILSLLFVQRDSAI